MPKIISQEEVEKRIAELYEKNIKLISPYSLSDKLHKFFCLAEGCGHEWESRFDHVHRSIYRNKKSGCAKCAKKIFLDSIEKRIKELFERNIKLCDPFVDTQQVYKFACLVEGCGHEWKANFSHVYKKSKCAKCEKKIVSPDNIHKKIENLLSKNIKLITPYKSGKKTKNKFVCLVEGCGHEWESILRNVIKAPSCAKCKQRFISQEETTNQLLSKNIKLLTPYTTSVARNKFLCLKEGCGHEWETIFRNVYKRNGCPKCAGNYLSPDDLQKRINYLLSKNIRLLSPYTGTNNKHKFVCLIEGCGHEWETKFSHVYRKTGCPCHSKSGYKVGKEGYFYIITYSMFVKYGITNHCSTRLNTHKQNGEFCIIVNDKFENGKIPFNIEKQIKKHFKKGYLTKIEFPDGYTETVSLENVDKLITLYQELKQHYTRND